MVLDLAFHVDEGLIRSSLYKSCFVQVGRIFRVSLFHQRISYLFPPLSSGFHLRVCLFLLIAPVYPRIFLIETSEFVRYRKPEFMLRVKGSERCAGSMGEG